MMRAGCSVAFLAALTVVPVAAPASWAHDPSSGVIAVDDGCVFGSGPLRSFNLPLETQRINCRGRGTAVLETMGEALRTPYSPYRYPKGWLFRAPVLSVRVSPADSVEVQIAAPAQLWAHGDDGVKRNDGGDITLGTKWTIARERGPWPGFGARWGLKLPNTSDETGLGTDRTDVNVGAILSKTLGRLVQLDANVGLLIMGDPSREVDQVDVLTYGLAASVPLSERLAGVLEIEGASGKRRLGSLGQVRGGAIWVTPWPSVTLHGALSAGVQDDSPEWGARFGAGWTLSFPSR